MNIVCRRWFLQRLAKPRCVVDGHELVLEWNRIQFIPLVPRMDHQIVVKTAYWGRPLSAVRLSLVLEPGEVRNYQYRTPLLFWPGSLILVEPKQPGPRWRASK